MCFKSLDLSILSCIGFNKSKDWVKEKPTSWCKFCCLTPSYLDLPYWNTALATTLSLPHTCHRNKANLTSPAYGKVCLKEDSNKPEDGRNSSERRPYYTTILSNRALCIREKSISNHEHDACASSATNKWNQYMSEISKRNWKINK